MNSVLTSMAERPSSSLDCLQYPIYGKGVATARKSGDGDRAIAADNRSWNTTRDAK
jgi:hypothetical protein